MQVSAQKKDYKLPRPLLTNSDLTRLINSDEIQSIVKEPKVGAAADADASGLAALQMAKLSVF